MTCRDKLQCLSDEADDVPGLIGAGIDQVMRKFPVLRANVVLIIRRPMNRDQNVINLGRNLRMSSLIKNGSIGTIPGRPSAANGRLAKVIELRIADEAEFDSIPFKDDGLSSFG